MSLAAGAFAAPAALLADFQLLRPWWLLALPVLAWLAWSWRRRRHAAVWDGVVDPVLREHLLEPGGRGRRWRAWLPWTGAALAILALSGPSWQRAAQPLWEAKAPLVIAFDLSAPMLAGDLPPSRLARARSKVAALLRERRGGEVALVVYAGDAYTVAPLTEDPANVAVFLDALEPDIMPGGPAGQADAARAIDRASRLLRQAGFSGGGDILLVTGNANGAAATAAAARAAAAGDRVSVLEAMPRESASPVAGAIAAAGRGRSTTMTTDDADLRTLGVLDARAGAGTASARREGGAMRRDGGYWLLLPLLAIAAFAFRRNGAVAALALCLLVPWHPAAAAGVDWWHRADQQAHARLEQGAQAYRKGDYAAAADAWRGLPGADAAYNLGNALARQGRYPEAIAAYDAALRARPGMADALANRKSVQDAMQRKRDDRDERQGEGDRGEGQGTPDQGHGDAAGEPQPADAAAQAAEQAAREREREAARRARADDRGRPQDGGMREDARDTPAERERRLANQAQLQRVPDDPGGLLRARLQLEQARRRAGDGE